MKKIISLLIPALAALPSAAVAQPLMTYTYADIAYQWTYVNEDGYDNANGLDVQLSYTPIKHLALEGGYNYLNSSAHGELLNERISIGLNQNLFTYGGAGWYSIEDGLDIVARVGGVHANLDISGDLGGSSMSDDGVYSGVTLRYLAMEDLETDLNVLYSYIESSSWSYSLTGLYAIHENVALKGEAAIDNDADVALLGGVRFSL